MILRPALAIAATLLAFAPVPAAAAPISAQELSDREEVRTLLLEYGRLLDDRKLEEYSKLFARDGEWWGGFGVSRTPAGILAAMRKAFAQFPSDRSSRNYHVLTNMIVDVDGDTATAWSRWTFYVKQDNKPSVMVAGRYLDDLVREDGAWKFRKRVVISDIPYQDPREAAAGGATPKQ